MNIASLVRQQNRRAKGLTLIELVLVVAVLAILAGFIVPRLGFIRNLAGEAGNSTILQDATNQAVLYNTAIGHYPGGEDTLLNAGGTAYVNLDPKFAAAIVPYDLSTDKPALKSIVSQIDPAALSVTLYNHDETAGIAPGNSGTISTTLDNVAFTGKIAQIKIPVAADVTNKALNYQIYQAAYGPTKLDPTSGAPLDNTFLAAIGYGPGSEINGKTGLEAPALFNKDTTKYNRPVFLLKVFGKNSTNVSVPAGTSAATSITVAPDGSTVNTYLTKYAIDQNR